MNEKIEMFYVVTKAVGRDFHAKLNSQRKQGLRSIDLV